MKTTTFLLLILVTIAFIKLDYNYQLPIIQIQVQVQVSVFVASYMYGIRGINNNKYYFGRQRSVFLNKVFLFPTRTIITGSTTASTSKSKSKTTSAKTVSGNNLNTVLLSLSASFTTARTTRTIAKSKLNQYQLHTRSGILQMTQQQQEQQDTGFESNKNNESDSNGKRSLRRKLLGIQSETIESSSSQQQQTQLKQLKPKVIGHRGSIYDYLENTRAGFLKCATEYQCDGIELDVFLLPKCNTLIVFHGCDGNEVNPISGELTNYILDENEHTNNHPRRSIMDLTYNEVKLLQFNPYYKEFTCSKDIITNTTISYIPTLEQVLLDIKKSNTNCQIKIELKGPDVVQPVIELVEQLQMTEQCTYSSFNFTMLQQLRTLRPDKVVYPSGALFANELPNDYIQQSINVGVTEIHIKYDVCTKHIIQQIHTAGFTSMVWLRGPIGMNDDISTKYNDFGTTNTINTENSSNKGEEVFEEDINCYQILIDTGVQQICCNKPNLLLSMLNQKCV